MMWKILKEEWKITKVLFIKDVLKEGGGSESLIKITQDVFCEQPLHGTFLLPPCNTIACKALNHELNWILKKENILWLSDLK